MHVSIAYDFLPKTPSTHAAVVMDHFGVGFETGRHVIADGLEIPIQLGDVVAFTGPSGSGKSSLMRAAAAQLDGVLVADSLDLGDRILVDALDRPAAETMNLLAACGLGEAHLMLRTPAELSDGQRYRFRLALAVSRSPQWIVADEFTAALDRTLAKVIAFNLRKLATRTGIGFLVATTHEDEHKVVARGGLDVPAGLGVPHVGHEPSAANCRVDLVARSEDLRGKRQRFPAPAGMGRFFHATTQVVQHLEELVLLIRLRGIVG